MLLGLAPSTIPARDTNQGRLATARNVKALKATAGRSPPNARITRLTRVEDVPVMTLIG